MAGVLFGVLVLDDAPDHLELLHVLLVLVGHKPELLHEHDVLGVVDRRLRVPIHSEFLGDSIELNQILLDQDLSGAVAGSLPFLLVLLLFFGLAPSALVFLLFASAFGVSVQRVVDREVVLPLGRGHPPRLAVDPGNVERVRRLKVRVLKVRGILLKFASR